MRSKYVDEILKEKIEDFMFDLDYYKSNTDITKYPEIFQRLALARSLLNDSLKYFE